MELRKKFDVSRLPMTFYVHTLEFVKRSSWDPRCVVRFEAVEKEKIEMFVTGKFSAKLSKVVKNSKYFEKIWELFKKGGIENPDFLSRKAMYLAEVGNAEINLMMTDGNKARSIANARNDWWELTIFPDTVSSNGKEDACDLSLPGYAQIEEEFRFTITSVEKKEEQILYKLYGLYTDKAEQEKFWTNRKRNELDAIGQTTTFKELVIFYVGAALSCCILDNSNQPTAYFDMGVENSYAAKQLRKADPANYFTMRGEAQNSYNSIIADVQNFPNLDVIISHWHTDHTSILNDLAINYANINFWRQANFIVPDLIQAKGWAVTHAITVQGAAQAAGNQLQIIPYQNANLCYNIGLGWANFQVYKCDRNDRGRRTPNPHDHGIFGVLNLVSGNTIFLAGDCAYDTLSVGNSADPVLDNNGVGYDTLVVSHHGGKYTHTIGINKTQFIPVPVDGGEAFFSANGVAYNHPVPANVTANTDAGWQDFHTHHLPPQGYNFFFVQ